MPCSQICRSQSGRGTLESAFEKPFSPGTFLHCGVKAALVLAGGCFNSGQRCLKARHF